MNSQAVKYLLSLVIIGLLVWRFIPTGDDAEQWPQRTIRIVVPYGAGGGTDTFVRKVGPIFKQENLLPQSITILNQSTGLTNGMGSRTAGCYHGKIRPLETFHYGEVSGDHVGNGHRNVERGNPPDAPGEHSIARKDP